MEFRQKKLGLIAKNEEEVVEALDVKFKPKKGDENQSLAKRRRRRKKSKKLDVLQWNHVWKILAYFQSVGLP